jgi:PAS domain S-box-containing protein
MTHVPDGDLHTLTDAIAGLGIHDHLCLIYETQESQFAAVFPYIALGLERGEKCLYVVDDNTASVVMNGMRAAGIAVEPAIDAGRLVIVSKQDSYLKQGYFDPDWMIHFLKQATDEAKAAGFSGLRITGEMTWVLGGDPGSERLMEYEAKLNYFFPGHDALAICQYNRNRFSPEILKHVIYTHPLIIHEGMVCRNFYYIPPDEFLAAQQPAKEIDRLLTNIRGRAKAEEELRRGEGLLRQLVRERAAEAERAHHEQQEVFRILVENSPDIIARYDRDCKRTYVNPTYLKAAQIPRDELLARAPMQRSPMPQESAMILQNLLQRVLMKGVAEEVDVLWPKADNRVDWYNISAFPEFDRDGRAVSVMTVSRDITGRKRAEADLSRMNERFALAANAARLGVWDWNIQKNELVWDDRMYALYGVKRDDFAGAYDAWLKGVHPDDRAASDEISKQARRGEREYDTEFRVVWPDGSVHYLKAYGQFVRDAEGKPSRMTGVNYDITEQRRAQEEIRTLNQELEHRVADRTAQLEAATNELEALAYSLAHDLRAPLRGIDGFSQAILDEYAGMFDAQGKRHLDRIRSAAQFMGQLIDDMLNLVRVSRSTMNMQHLDLSTMMREIAHELTARDPERRVEFVIQKDVLVRGDGRLLRIALEHLLGNAWKFTSQHPAARIECGVQDNNGTPVYFVRDDGVGFDMRYAEKLFGAFQRLHSAPEYPGTGVGLAAVQRIIRRHGGTVWAEGKEEHGATFYFTLP